jgi:hypothetical protein
MNDSDNTDMTGSGWSRTLGTVRLWMGGFAGRNDFSRSLAVSKTPISSAEYQYAFVEPLRNAIRSSSSKETEAYPCASCSQQCGPDAPAQMQ